VEVLYPDHPEQVELLPRVGALGGEQRQHPDVVQGQQHLARELQEAHLCIRRLDQVATLLASSRVPLTPVELARIAEVPGGAAQGDRYPSRHMADLDSEGSPALGSGAIRGWGAAAPGIPGVSGEDSQALTVLGRAFVAADARPVRWHIDEHE
jgi:hypothetical protein